MSNRHEHKHEHKHEHGHSHHHHEVTEDTLKGRAFLLGIILNTLFVAGEFGAGFLFNSMGLLADAGHNLGDVSGLLISLSAFLLARKKYTRHFTYGYRKGTIWATLFNAVILLAAAGIIVAECIRKFIHPEPVGGFPIIITAGLGIIVNGLTVLVFARGKEEDLNVKGAYLHMLADALVSAGVVISGILIMCTGWSIIDPVIGIVIALVILFSTWGLLRDSIRLGMDGVPPGLSAEKIRDHLQKHGEVQAVHHLHIWPISTTENAMTAHIVLKSPEKLEEVRAALRSELSVHGIGHATLEFETCVTECADKNMA